MSQDQIDAMAYWYKSMHHAELNENPKWIDFLKKLKEKSKMSFYSNGDNTTMQCDIDYANQKEQLIREQQNKEYELKAEYEETLSKVRNTYSQAILDLEKKYEESKVKESAENHAKTLKAFYDGYIGQGFTKKQAKHFIKIILENQSK